MATLKAGAKLKSAVCDTQLMVIKAPAGEHDLRCAGVPMVVGNDPVPTGATGDTTLMAGTLIGKRYVNTDESLELLCTKGGQGSLTLGAVALEIKQAKQLPSSD